MSLTGQQAAVIVAGNALLSKLAMTMMWRVPMFVSSKKATLEMLNDKKFKANARTQLNESEWAPYLLVLLLWTDHKGLDTGMAPVLCAFGQVAHLWVGLLAPSLPPAIGRMPTYAAAGLMVKALYDEAF